MAAFLGSRQYKQQKEADRRSERVDAYAEALQVVEEYMKAPFTVMRRVNTPEATVDITNRISEIQTRIQFSRAWLDISSPKNAGKPHSELITTARREVEPMISDAWLQKPRNQASDVPLGTRLEMPQSAAIRTQFSAALREDLGTTD